jgi:hypothetical protein
VRAALQSPLARSVAAPTTACRTVRHQPWPACLHRAQRACPGDRGAYGPKDRPDVIAPDEKRARNGFWSAAGSGFAAPHARPARPIRRLGPQGSHRGYCVDAFMAAEIVGQIPAGRGFRVLPTLVTTPSALKTDLWCNPRAPSGAHGPDENVCRQRPMLSRSRRPRPPRVCPHRSVASAGSGKSMGSCSRSCA